MTTGEPDDGMNPEEPGEEPFRKAKRPRGGSKASVGAGGGGTIRRSRAIVMMILFFGLGLSLDRVYLHFNSSDVACETSVLLATGSSLGDFTLYDLADDAFALSTLCAGRAALIVFEDKDVGGQNEDFKKRFGALQSTLGDPVVLIPVADVSTYNYWPAKGFVKDALRDAGRKSGITVYADWSGKGRTLLRPRPKLSNLVFIDKSKKVLWASSGQLTISQQDELLELVKSVAR